MLLLAMAAFGADEDEVLRNRFTVGADLFAALQRMIDARDPSYRH